LVWPNKLGETYKICKKKRKGGRVARGERQGKPNGNNSGASGFDKQPSLKKGGRVKNGAGKLRSPIKINLVAQSRHAGVPGEKEKKSEKKIKTPETSAKKGKWGVDESVSNRRAQQEKIGGSKLEEKSINTTTRLKGTRQYIN